MVGRHKPSHFQGTYNTVGVASSLAPSFYNSSSNTTTANSAASAGSALRYPHSNDNLSPLLSGYSQVLKPKPNP